MNCELTVSLGSDTPVVGIEINPYVCIFPKIPGHVLEFNWYRLNNEKPTCSVHHSEVATLQCMCCEVLKIPVKERYFCSAKCFLDTWQKHHRLHSEAADCLGQMSSGEDKAPGEIKRCGSWKSADHWSAFKEGPLPNEISTVAVGYSWLKVGSSKNYVPSQDDFGKILRLESVVRDREEGNPLAPTDIIQTDPVIMAPIYHPRRLIEVGPLVGLEKFNLEAHSTVAGTFTVLTYNVLSNFYVKNDMYSYCPKWALAWEYRRKNLLREIIGYKADILCLQEVQSDHFQNFFEPQLVQRGYSVIYKKKENHVCTSGGSVVDGCATFFRRDRFREVIKYELEFSKLARSVVEALHPGQRDTSHNQWIKDNVAVIVILEAMESGAVSDTLDYRFCVANTHILAKPEYKDVKLWQVATLVNGLEKIADSHIPILICGDLNSLPGSAAHDLLVKGRVTPNHDDLLTDRVGILRHMKLFHNIPLVSAYSSFRATEKQRKMMDLVSYEPLFTNFTENFSGTIDYILYSADRFVVKGLLDLLDQKSAKKNTALPSPEWSSDHIALMVKFCLKPNAKRPAPPLPAFLW